MRVGFEQRHGGFVIARLGKPRSEQSHQCGMGFGQSLPVICCPLGVLVFRQQRACPERECGLKRGGFATFASGGGRLLERVDVDPQPTGRAEPYDFVIDRDGFGSHQSPDAMDDLIEIVRGRLRCRLRPQSVGNDVAMHPVPGRQREQLHQRLGLPQTPTIFNGLPGHLGRETTQQRDVDFNWRRGFPHCCIFPRCQRQWKDLLDDCVRGRVMPVGDPLNEQTETITTLRQVFEAAGSYLEGLPERLV